MDRQKFILKSGDIDFLFQIIRLFYGIFYLITINLRIKIITINIIYKNTSLKWVLHSLNFEEL
jgi:hypothetical protein